MIRYRSRKKDGLSDTNRRNKSSTEPRTANQRQTDVLDEESVVHVNTGSGFNRHPLVQLQKRHGNQAIQRLLGERGQLKIEAGSPDDKYEQEANRVAELVIRLNEPSILGETSNLDANQEEKLTQDKPLFGDISPLVQRQDDNERVFQINSFSRSSMASDQQVVDDDVVSPSGTGRPLDSGFRTVMEEWLDHEFGQVRVHTGQDATEAAKAINARAYTIGSDIVFGANQYAPTTKKGRQLLAHELTHVVQQSGGGKTDTAVQRWTDLGEERWKIPVFPEHVMPVRTGTKDEWKKVLESMDSEDAYHANLEGFLKVSNNPSIVKRTEPPRRMGLSKPSEIPYSNTITRAPNRTEKLAFLQALYEMGGDLDLWRGGLIKDPGGQWTRVAENDLSTFINKNQEMLITDVSSRGAPVEEQNIKAVSTQAGKKTTMSMIINAGATAHKGVDLIVAANRKTGVAKERALNIAYQTIRNAGRVIKWALDAHKARVAFQQGVISGIFDRVWSLIPGGGVMADEAKNLLKEGLKTGLEEAQKQGGPQSQAKEIQNHFEETCNNLVQEGHITSAEAQLAIEALEVA